jgi:hypothetical protein
MIKKITISSIVVLISIILLNIILQLGGVGVERSIGLAGIISGVIGLMTWNYIAAKNK